jgi:anti-anti-sigma factor
MRDERDFSLRTEAHDATVQMTLGGELDMGAAFRLEPAFDSAVSGGDVRSVALDLAAVTLVDSAGIGALLSIRERAHQLGIELALTRVSQPVRRIFDLTGVSGTFGVSEGGDGV